MKHDCTHGLIQVDRWNATVECERNEPGGVLCLGCAERARIVAIIKAFRTEYIADDDTYDWPTHERVNNLLAEVEGGQSDA